MNREHKKVNCYSHPRGYRNRNLGIPQWSSQKRNLKWFNSFAKGVATKATITKGLMAVKLLLRAIEIE